MATWCSSASSRLSRTAKLLWCSSTTRLLLKRVYTTEKGVILKPENPAYEPMFFSHEDFRQVRILGKAVAFQSKL